jgi:PAS domain S-box-containing protein
MSWRISILNRFGIVSAIVLSFLVFTIIFRQTLFYTAIFDLHGECYRWIPSLLALHVVSDLCIGLAYVFISYMLFITIRQIKLPFNTIFIAFGAFIICCGTTHFMEIITTIWTPVYWLAGYIKLVTAIASLGTAIMLPPLIPKVRATISAAKRFNEQSQETAKLYVQLRESYTALADAMPLLVWRGNAQGESEYFNTMWRDYTGCKEEELFKGVTQGRFTHPDDYQRTQNYWRSQLQQGGMYEVETRLKRYDGAFFWHIVRAIPMRTASGLISGWISTATNIDKQKRNEQALRESQERQDTFLSMTSHELKTPLTSMQILISFFRREIVDMKYGKAIATMENQLQRLARLVNDLLDMSRIKTNQLSLVLVSCDIAEVATEVVRMIQMSTSTHSLVLVCDTSVRVQADHDRLEQVMVNILTNAVKYSPNADRVDIRVTTDKHNALFSVQDYGIGISQEDQAHIFEQYYRSIGLSNQKYAGLGIGLYIASEIIQRHNGRIWVESEEGKGSIFSFSLPLERDMISQDQEE